MEKVLFKEEQRFRQWWIWLLMVIALLVVIVQLTNAKAEEQSGLISSDERLILYGVVAALFLTTFIIVTLFVKLKTKITYDGIYVAYIPFARKWKKIAKDDIAGYELRKFHAYSEYGGYGMKTKRKAGKAYTISGNKGLQLYYKDGKKMLIGTQKAQAIEYAMIKLLGKEKKTASVKDYTQQPKPGIGKKAKKILIVLAIEIVLIIVIFSLIQIFK